MRPGALVNMDARSSDGSDTEGSLCDFIVKDELSADEEPKEASASTTTAQVADELVRDFPYDRALLAESGRRPGALRRGRRARQAPRRYEDPDYRTLMLRGEEGWEGDASDDAAETDGEEYDGGSSSSSSGSESSEDEGEKRKQRTNKGAGVGAARAKRPRLTVETGASPRTRRTVRAILRPPAARAAVPSPALK